MYSEQLLGCSVSFENLGQVAAQTTQLYSRRGTLAVNFDSVWRKVFSIWTFIRTFSFGKHKVKVMKVTDEGELWDCAKFFVEVCADKRGYFKNIEIEREHIFQDYIQKRKTVFVAKSRPTLFSKSRIVATLSVMTEIGEQYFLEIDQIFPEAREYLQGGRAQISNLAALPDSEVSECVFVPLMTQAMIHIMQSGKRHLQIIVNPRHRLWYERKLGFKPLAGGEVRMHPHLEKAPAVGLYFNMDWCMEVPFIRERIAKYGYSLA